MANLLGLYEKALPFGMNWLEKLAVTKALRFDYMEISIDESKERLQRLHWDNSEKSQLVRAMEKTEMPIMSMCFSGHRRYPLGSRDESVRQHALELMEKAIEFAYRLGIRVIQLAGYDVYYEEHGKDTERYFMEGLKRSVAMAEKYQVMLAMEIMDTPFLNSIQKYMHYDKEIGSPWLAVYPDLGNLSAWNNIVETELEVGKTRIVGVHVKETQKVTDNFAGKFRDVPFGEGTVDFHAAFTKLKALAYGGPFLLEMWGENMENPLGEIARSRQFVIDRLAACGFAY
jgi:hexulose-6-phosphate isomerase